MWLLAQIQHTMNKTKVALVGLGTVGAGVARLLLDHGDRTARHAGRSLWLEHVVVKDTTKPRQIQLPEGVLSDDLSRIIDDRDIKVVAQLIGGLEPARSVAMVGVQRWPAEPQGRPFQAVADHLVAEDWWIAYTPLPVHYLRGRRRSLW